MAQMWRVRRPDSLVDLRQRAKRWFTDDRGEELQIVAEISGRTVGWARACFMDATDEGPANCVPAAWYLLGLNVAADCRRRGIGAALTAARLEWLAERTDAVHYFTDVENAASLALHAGFGFEVVACDVWFPGIDSHDAPMVLLRAILPGHGNDVG